MNTKEYIVAFYTYEGDGTYSELVLDLCNHKYEYQDGAKKEDLFEKDDNISKIKINRNALETLFDIAIRLYDISVIRESKKPIVNSETVWKALKSELSARELYDIINNPYEKNDYYDYHLLYAKIHDCIRGKVIFEDLLDWLTLMMRCLKSNDITDEALRDEYKNLADLIDRFLDGYANQIDYDWLSKRHKCVICRDLLAKIKWVNHKIENLRQGEKTDFTTNDVITYISCDFSMGNDLIERVCIVDKNRKRINFFYTTAIDYRIGINYTFLSEDEFDALPRRYAYDYKFDSAMPADYAITKDLVEKPRSKNE